MIATTDNDIRRAAIGRFGVTDAITCRYEAKPFRSNGHKQDDSDIDDSGTWFMLFLRKSPDSELWKNRLDADGDGAMSYWQWSRTTAEKGLPFEHAKGFW